MKKILLFCCLLFAISSVRAQDFEKNLQKYWKYRERLKNFVVPGDCQGCGYPALNISWGTIDYPDETIELGHYLMFLATENYLLNYYGQSDAENRKDLFYAMEAFNRLDRTAEYWWSQMGANATNYSPNPNSQQDLNGFFIRDDNRWFFLDDIYNGKTIETTLWDHYVPFADGKRKVRTANSFNERDWYARSGDYSHGGPTEVSLDQIIGMTEGLAFVAKFLDPNFDYPGHQFWDGETKFATEARKISKRISDFCKLHNFTLENPVSGQCVKATDWKNNNCSDGGAYFWDLSHGYALADANIQSNFNNGLAASYYQSNYGVNTWPKNQAVNNLWNGKYKNDRGFVLKEEDKILTLAAVSNIWGSQTSNILAERCVAKYNDYHINLPHMALMHSLLHNVPTSFSGNAYQCMLNNAPPEGQNSYDHNWEWSNNRLTYGPNGGGLYYEDNEMKGVDYLAYFNLYCIYTIQNNQNYVQNYRVIPALELCSENDLVKTGKNLSTYKEWDFKRFAAVNSITAGNINGAGDYWIRKYDGITDGNPPEQICDESQFSNYRDNRNDGLTSCTYDALESQDQSFVEFLAGAEITLKPGFTVSNGGELHAHIQAQGLKLMEKGTINPYAQCSVCEGGGSEAVTGFLANKISDHKYKMLKCTPNEILAITPHIIFKVKDNGYAGDNIFDIEYNAQGGYQVKGDDGNYYLLGYNDFRLNGFSSEIVDADFINGVLLVCFENGSIIKLNGIGGTGHQMFMNINANYILGSYTFNHGKIHSLEPFGNEILVALNMNNKSKIIKFNGTGGTGYNFWSMAVDNPNSASGGSVAGFQLFDGKITQMKNVKNDLFVCTRNGVTDRAKILKIAGTGGGGANMCNISEPNINSNFAFLDESVNNNYPKYYIGDQKFKISNSYITAFESLNNGDEIVLGTRDGRALRLQNGGAGANPSGHYMFNIDVNSPSFAKQSLSGSDYRMGYSDYHNGWSGWVFNTNYTYVSDIEFLDGYLILGFHDGHLLKVDINTYSNNANSFAIGNQTGYSDFGTSVVQVYPVGDRTFITFSNGLVLCGSKSGGTGANNYAVKFQNDPGTNTKNGWQPLCGYDYYIGSQDFDDMGAGARLAMDNTDQENTNSQSEEIAEEAVTFNKEIITQCWPNPADDVLNVEAECEEYTELMIQVSDIAGKFYEPIIIESGKTHQLNLASYASGLYFLSFKTKNGLILSQKKFVKQ